MTMCFTVKYIIRHLYAGLRVAYTYVYVFIHVYRLTYTFFNFGGFKASSSVSNDMHRVIPDYTNHEVEDKRNESHGERKHY